MKTENMSCYLDNAATTKISSEMKDYLISMLDIFGNPSSAHSEGVKSNTVIANVRQKVQKFIGASSTDEIIFTSSGSASNTLGISGITHTDEYNIFYSPTSHKSILRTVDSISSSHGINSVRLKVDSYGNIDKEYLIQSLEKSKKENNKRALVVVEYANSEIGTIQDIKNISDITHRYNGVIFVDCTGSISTIPLNVSDLGVDMASFSAHKIGALKGVGVLYKKNDVKIYPLIFGSQEQGLFAGTENLLGIISLGKAIDLLDYHNKSRSRDFVWDNIKKIQGLYLVGAPLTGNRLTNNIYCCIKGVAGNDIVAFMDDVYKTQVSTGSACNNGYTTPSPTLLAIGMSGKDIYSCVRISFSGHETQKELEEFCKNFNTCIKMIRSF